MADDLEVIEGEVVEELAKAGLPVERHTPSINLFGDTSPVEVIAKATEVATALASVIEDKQLFTQIKDKKHVRVEGWTLLGSMLGVYPIIEWTRPLSNGWEARCVAYTRDGAVVGAAEAQCLNTEGRPWNTADGYALRSMAQTRAVSKALRHPLGFVVTLAGYDATPEAEAFRDDQAAGGQGQQRPRPQGSAQNDTGYPLPSSWPKVQEAIQVYGDSFWKDWLVFGAQAKDYLYPDGPADREQKAHLRRVSAEAAKHLRDNHPGPDALPPPSLEDMRTAWSVALGPEVPDLAGPSLPEDTEDE